MAAAQRRTTSVVFTGLGLIQNLRRAYYELAIESPRQLRVTAAFTELAHAI